LRALLAYRDAPEIGEAIGLLLVWLALFIGEAALSRRWSRYFLIYLVIQTLLVLALFYLPLSPDYFAVLFFILSMQIMQRLTPRLGAVCVGLFTPLMTLPLANMHGVSEGIALTLIFTAGNALLAFYALATRRAQQARAQNQLLARELQETNRQLQAYATQLEQLAAARERHRLARELHDSVTQTIFSMTLTTQSALLLLERAPDRVGAQLERLNELAQSALAEMHVLISRLRPEKIAAGGLVAALRQHLADRHLPENLSVSLQVEGDQPLAPAEEQSLFRIAQEALNNIVKHAQASQARIRLHLTEPFWMEIEDQGQGFDLPRARNSGRVGLVSMHERAAEIGWKLQVSTVPGAGTRIRVDKSVGNTTAKSGRNRLETDWVRQSD
jgi:signal transduction histidine kinase